jgi:hypothetical protein
MADPVLDPGSPAQKPGYKTTEFWLSLAAMLIGALLAADVFPSDSPVLKILGVVSSILGALGYQVSRAIVKSSGNKSAALVEASKQAGPQ